MKFQKNQKPDYSNINDFLEKELVSLGNSPTEAEKKKNAFSISESNFARSAFGHSSRAVIEEEDMNDGPMLRVVEQWNELLVEQSDMLHMGANRLDMDQLEPDENPSLPDDRMQQPLIPHMNIGKTLTLRKSNFAVGTSRADQVRDIINSALGLVKDCHEVFQFLRATEALWIVIDEIACYLSKLGLSMEMLIQDPQLLDLIHPVSQARKLVKHFLKSIEKIKGIQTKGDRNVAKTLEELKAKARRLGEEVKIFTNFFYVCKHLNRHALFTGMAHLINRLDLVASAGIPSLSRLLSASSENEIRVELNLHTAFIEDCKKNMSYLESFVSEVSMVILEKDLTESRRKALLSFKEDFAKFEDAFLSAKKEIISILDEKDQELFSASLLDVVHATGLKEKLMQLVDSASDLIKMLEDALQGTGSGGMNSKGEKGETAQGYMETMKDLKEDKRKEVHEFFLERFKESNSYMKSKTVEMHSSASSSKKEEIEFLVDVNRALDEILSKLDTKR